VLASKTKIIQEFYSFILMLLPLVIFHFTATALTKTLAVIFKRHFLNIELMQIHDLA